jgi:hypothetical protein
MLKGEDLFLLRKSAEAHNQVRFTTSGVFEDCQTQGYQIKTTVKLEGFVELTVYLREGTVPKCTVPQLIY